MRICIEWRIETSGLSTSIDSYAQEMQDVRAVVERLRGEGWEVRAILGHSKGGIIALM
jgi:alpha-beta hydrolase superfamily lysophospholipase